MESLVQQIDAADKALKKKTDESANKQQQISANSKTTPVPPKIAKSDRDNFKKLGAEIQKLLRLQKRNDGQKNKLRNYFGKLDAEQRELRSALNAAKKTFSQQGGHRANVMVMKELSGDPEPAYLLQRGQYNEPDKSQTLTRGVPAVLLPDGIKQPTDRLELARWIVSKNNPLTARVIVNRIWRDHFGTGLVKSTGDFGVQGDAPSHPDLLDWLAIEFIDSGWDMKALHRLILTSQTYRQSSRNNERLQSIDPKNRLLARGPRYRADGFSIRDIALQASGLLNEKLGGPAVKPYQPEGLWEVVAGNKDTRYTPDKGDSLYRKSLYSY